MKQKLYKWIIYHQNYSTYIDENIAGICESHYAISNHIVSLRIINSFTLHWFRRSLCMLNLLRTRIVEWFPIAFIYFMVMDESFLSDIGLTSNRGILDHPKWLAIWWRHLMHSNIKDLNQAMKDMEICNNCLLA